MKPLPIDPLAYPASSDKGRIVRLLTKVQCSLKEDSISEMACRFLPDIRQALDELKKAGLVCQTPAGWQLIETSEQSKNPRGEYHSEEIRHMLMDALREAIKLKNNDGWISLNDFESIAAKHEIDVLRETLRYHLTKMVAEGLAVHVKVKINGKGRPANLWRLIPPSAKTGELIKLYLRKHGNWSTIREISRDIGRQENKVKMAMQRIIDNGKVKTYMGKELRVIYQLHDGN